MRTPIGWVSGMHDEVAGVKIGLVDVQQENGIRRIERNHRAARLRRNVARGPGLEGHFVGKRCREIKIDLVLAGNEVPDAVKTHIYVEPEGIRAAIAQEIVAGAVADDGVVVGRAVDILDIDQRIEHARRNSLLGRHVEIDRIVVAGHGVVAAAALEFVEVAGGAVVASVARIDAAAREAGGIVSVVEIGAVDDRANYGAATGPIAVQLAAGIVTGTGANASGVGTDTLQSIELVTGSNFADTFDATGFSSASVNAGSTVTNNTAGLFNEFEGKGGDDVITGNGQTRVSYYHATSGVTVTLTPNSWTSSTSGASGYATGDASVGTDHFTGVAQVRGSYFDDVFYGSNNPNFTAEYFEGLGGNDLIYGGTGFDRAQYFQAGDNTGIVVNLASGIVTGGVDTGTDTLRSVEAIPEPP